MEKIIQLLVHSILAISFIILPYISRRDVAFGVKIPTAAFNESSIKKIRQQYIIAGTILSLIFAGIYLMDMTEKVYITLIFSSIVLYFILYIYFNRKMKELKSSFDWAVDEKTVIDMNFRQRKISISSKWYLLYLLLFVINVALLLLNYDQIPEMMRTNFNGSGEVTGTTPKDQGILILLGTQACVMLLMVFVQYVIKRAKQEIDPNKAQDSIKNNVKFRYMISVLLYLIGLSVGFVMIMTTLLVLGIIADPQLFMILTLVLSFAPIIVLFIMGVKYRQDGTGLSEETNEVVQKDDDDYWKLGMFYYNSNDPSIFINKRAGIGWTVNHARWQAWALYAVIIGLIVFAIVTGA